MPTQGNVEEKVLREIEDKSLKEVCPAHPMFVLYIKTMKQDINKNFDELFYEIKKINKYMHKKETEEELETQKKFADEKKEYKKDEKHDKWVDRGIGFVSAIFVLLIVEIIRYYTPL